MKKRILLGAAMAAALFASTAYAGGLWPTLPSAPGPLSGVEDFPADTNYANGASPQSETITTAQMGGYVAGLPTRGNVLIGGDATTNLWQRGTTGASETTTYAYGGPDRWAYWSGTSTAMTVSRDSTAADLPSGYEYAFKMARTSAQTGVVQMCMAQEVESANSYQFQGQTAELDFHAYTGANFSAANYNMTAYIVTGTGADEGMQKLAYGLNAGGGGSTGWTGQANATAAVISLGGVSTAGRYAAVAAIPSTATEIGVVLCYTPVGTAGANDYVAFDGIQLIRNGANSASASATVGYNDATFPGAAFERRPQALETLYQQRYTYSFTESTTASVTETPAGIATSTTVCNIGIPFPVVMRAAPTYANALTASTFVIEGGDHANQALSTPYSATAGANTPQNASVNFTTGATLTQYWPCQLLSVASGTGNMLWSAEL